MSALLLHSTASYLVISITQYQLTPVLNRNSNQELNLDKTKQLIAIRKCIGNWLYFNSMQVNTGYLLAINVDISEIRCITIVKGLRITIFKGLHV